MRFVEVIEGSPLLDEVNGICAASVVVVKDMKERAIQRAMRILRELPTMYAAEREREGEGNKRVYRSEAASFVLLTR